MGFVAEGSLDSAESAEALFDRLIDHGNWIHVMPCGFSPMGSSRGQLKVGDRVQVRIAGRPSLIAIATVRRPLEISWTGGTRGVLYAEHRFLFEQRSDGGTRVRSVETWEGVLTPFVKPIVKRLAERIGKQQLEGLVGRAHAGR